MSNVERTGSWSSCSSSSSSSSSLQLVTRPEQFGQRHDHRAATAVRFPPNRLPLGFVASVPELPSYRSTAQSTKKPRCDVYKSRALLIASHRSVPCVAPYRPRRPGLAQKRRPFCSNPQQAFGACFASRACYRRGDTAYVVGTLVKGVQAENVVPRHF